MLFSYMAFGLMFIASYPLALILLICVIYFVCFGIYNRFFHPLRRVPGPFWASVTDVYLTCLFGTKRAHLETLALHGKYGPYVRLAPNIVSVSDPTLLPKIYHKHAEKLAFYSTAIAGEKPPLLMINDDKAHAAKLKFLYPTYSVQRTHQLEGTIDENIVATEQAFRRRFSSTGLPLDMAEWARWHLYDTITHMIYGKSVGMVKEGRDVDQLILQWRNTFRLGGLVSTLPWLIYPIIWSWPLKYYLMPRKGHKSWSGHIMTVHEKLFKNRLENPHLAQPGNLFDSLIQSKRPDGTKMTLEEAEHEFFILTVSSQDTSAAFVSAFINCVLQNSEIHANLVSEIEKYDREGRLSKPVVTYDETTEMPYFMACCQETLRFSPSVSMILPRFAPKEGIDINGTWVSGNMQLAGNPYVLNRGKDVFGADANEFRPERWLEDEERIKRMNKYLSTFGYGSRKCIGKNIALFESQKFCLQLFRNFHVQVQYPEQPCRVENWGTNLHFDQFILLRDKEPGV